MDHELKTLPFEIKEINEDEGTFTGYAATFSETPDSYGDIIDKGAFKKTLKEGAKRIKILWNHYILEPIGKPLELTEDDKGLFVKGKLSLGVQRAREVLSLMKDGVITELSIGYDAIKAPFRDGVRHLQEIRLWDISPVVFAANPDALITGVKNELGTRDFEILDSEASEVKFAGSPKNKYGTHTSKGFKGDYAAAWRCHFSQVDGGSTSATASGPIRGTVRRVSMIAQVMKPVCELIGTDSVAARKGPKSPLKCTFPDKPSDYGLSAWAKPSDDDLEQEDIRLTCADLNVIKKAALAEIKRRAEDREEEEASKSDELKPYPNEHACRLRNPDDFQEGSFRRTSRVSDGKKYSVIMGRLEGEDTLTEQAYRYDREVWEEGEAKGHCKDHDGTFEPAKEKTFKCECIDCGHKVESKKHCSDIKCPECGGEMRRAGRPGPGKSGEKAGRVLSAANLEKVQRAFDALQALLESLEEEEEPAKATQLSNEASAEAVKLETLVNTLKAENEDFQTEEAEARIEAILAKLKEDK